MHIVIGASGQVGSAVVRHLREKGEVVKGVIRDEKKAAPLREAGASVALADVHDLPALTAAFAAGTTLFAITPESEHSQDVLGETAAVLDNYRKAVEQTGLQHIVGLSSQGAQHEKGTGNLQMSYMLEHAFKDMAVKQTFIRPAYYFSNWLPYLDAVKESGKLPTFFPPDLAIPMVSPMDVAAFAAKLMTMNSDAGPLYEIEAPAHYSSQDVADAFGAALGKPVQAEQMERDGWESALQQLGFSRDGIKNFIDMTAAVISGLASRNRDENHIVKADTTLQQYIDTAVKGSGK
jgi:uncharacterized protein YbjT (DUF2867 family)